MALEEDKGRNKEPRGKVEQAVAGIKEKLFGNEKLETAQAKAEAVGEKLEIQKEKLAQIKAALEAAAKENKDYNVLKGKVDANLGPMKVWQSGENSLVVSFRDRTATQGAVDMLQVSIDMNDAGKEISVFKAPYGPSESFSIQNVTPAITKSTELVRNYRHYPERAA